MLFSSHAFWRFFCCGRTCWHYVRQCHVDPTIIFFRCPLAYFPRCPEAPTCRLLCPFHFPFPSTFRCENSMYFARSICSTARNRVPVSVACHGCDELASSSGHLTISGLSDVDRWRLFVGIPRACSLLRAILPELFSCTRFTFRLDAGSSGNLAHFHAARVLCLRDPTLLCLRHHFRCQRSDFLRNFVWAAGSNLELGHRPLSLYPCHSFIPFHPWSTATALHTPLVSFLDHEPLHWPSSLILFYHELGHRPFSLYLWFRYLHHGARLSFVLAPSVLFSVFRIVVTGCRFFAVCIIICSAHRGLRQLFFCFYVFRSFTTPWSSVFTCFARPVSCLLCFVLSFPNLYALACRRFHGAVWGLCDLATLFLPRGAALL